MESRIKALIREPALLLDAFETGVVVAVSLGLFSISGEQQRDVVAAFIAVLALAKAFLTKPFPVLVITDLGRALLVLVGSFSLVHLNADQITLLVTFLGTLTSLVSRAQVTPRYDPVVVPGGAGAGPVAGTSGEEGAVDILAVLGIALIIIGIIGLLGVIAISLPVSVILIVVGILLLVLPYARTGIR